MRNTASEVCLRMVLCFCPGSLGKGPPVGRHMVIAMELKSQSISMRLNPSIQASPKYGFPCVLACRCHSSVMRCLNSSTCRARNGKELLPDLPPSKWHFTPKWHLTPTLLLKLCLDESTQRKHICPESIFDRRNYLHDCLRSWEQPTQQWFHEPLATLDGNTHLLQTSHHSDCLIEPRRLLRIAHLFFSWVEPQSQREIVGHRRCLAKIWKNVAETRNNIKEHQITEHILYPLTTGHTFALVLHRSWASSDWHPVSDTSCQIICRSWELNGTKWSWVKPSIGEVSASNVRRSLLPSVRISSRIPPPLAGAGYFLPWDSSCSRNSKWRWIKWANRTNTLYM